MSKVLHSILVLFALEKNEVSMTDGMLEATYSSFCMYYLRKSVFFTLQSVVFCTVSYVNEDQVSAGAVLHSGVGPVFANGCFTTYTRFPFGDYSSIRLYWE